MGMPGAPDRKIEMAKRGLGGPPGSPIVGALSSGAQHARVASVHFGQVSTA